ncbi:MAG: hypothetical protein HIU93_15095 [Acidobacteria bacterium]|nr:hypothetical protein [Acidobacteriota bacterium]
MRLEFKYPSQAKRWFKISKLVLADAVSGPANSKLLTCRIRNAMCRGFGYSSFNELEYLFKKRRTGDIRLPSADEILHAFSVGFFLALNEARALGFSHKLDPKGLATQLAADAVRLVNEREDELAKERERHSADQSREIVI